MVTYSLIVVKIKYEANDTVTLCFRQPAIRKIKYLSGQYIALVFRINGLCIAGHNSCKRKLIRVNLKSINWIKN